MILLTPAHYPTIHQTRTCQASSHRCMPRGLTSVPLAPWTPHGTSRTVIDLEGSSLRRAFGRARRGQHRRGRVTFFVQCHRSTKWHVRYVLGDDGRSDGAHDVGRNDCRLAHRHRCVRSTRCVDRLPDPTKQAVDSCRFCRQADCPAKARAVRAAQQFDGRARAHARKLDAGSGLRSKGYLSRIETGAR